MFDKRGTFSSYYVERCDELFEEVRADERAHEAFFELLEGLFYEVADLVYDHVERGEYDAVRSELLRFDEY